jgi:hypothetical protein
MSQHEHDYEPVRGLPGRLPPGETILWQGAPRAASLARYGFHLGALGFYFAVLLVWCGGRSVAGGMPALGLLTLMAELAGLALAALGLIALFAWLTARTTVYTITNRRVVVRFGIAFQLSLNLPFAAIEGADLRRCGDGMGYVILWPHVRPWRWARAQPMLRSIPDADRVAQILSRALAASSSQPARPVPVLAGAATGTEQRHEDIPGSAVVA